MATSEKKSKLDQIEEILEQAESIHQEATNVLRGNGISGVRAFLNSKERLEIKRLKIFLKQMDEENRALRDKVEALESIKAMADPKPKKLKKRKTKDRKSAVLALSDIHLTELVDPSSNSYGNEHNEEIGRERVRFVIDQAVNHLKAEASKSDLSHLQVALLGDFMVNADLHYKMERSTPYEPLVEMEVVYAMLDEEIGRLLNEQPCDSVVITGDVSNHDRDTDQMQMGMSVDRSYDVAMYHRLAAKYNSASWHIARTYYTTTKVGDFCTTTHHGHARGASMKENAVGVMIPRWTWLNQQHKIYNFNLWVQGHHHSSNVISSPFFTHVSNGSTVGHNGYANDSGFRPEPPSQQLVFINHETSTVDHVQTINAEAK